MPDPLPTSNQNSAAYVWALSQLLYHTKLTYPGGEGTGVLYVGGGAKYWPLIATGCHLLRETGYTGPVEVWHRGTCEPVRPEQVAGLGIDIYDTDKVVKQSRIPRGQAGTGGWEAKLEALTHTTLDRVLYLDADSYLVNHPQRLFKILDEVPFAYWEDLPHCENNIRWPEVWPGGKNGVPTVQGGQLLIDRRNAWTGIVTAHWMCQHSDFYFSRMFGDQDCWRTVLASGVIPYRCLGKAPWHKVAFCCPWEATDYVVHRCQGKDFARPNWDLPKERDAYELFKLFKLM